MGLVGDEQLHRDRRAVGALKGSKKVALCKASARAPPPDGSTSIRARFFSSRKRALSRATVRPTWTIDGVLRKATSHFTRVESSVVADETEARDDDPIPHTQRNYRSDAALARTPWRP